LQLFKKSKTVICDFFSGIAGWPLTVALHLLGHGNPRAAQRDFTPAARLSS
jgi:hypothetical protein